MFEPFVKNPHLPEEESKIFDFWQKKRIFYKSCDQRLNSKEFVFYDGPPFATGLPHHGHLLVSTIKDIVARYATMQGFHVRRRFGWDCHGLPVEYEIEKKLEISGKKEIEKFGIDRFNEECRSIVQRYTAEWEQVVTRLGRWVDFNDQYRTMDPDYMESVWWVFHQLWEKDLIYQSYRIQPFCSRCSTPLSNFETNLGYQDRQDPSVTVTCPQTDADVTFLVWTTTPWTLPANVAICAGPEIDYDFVEHEGQVYVVASSRREAYFEKEAKVTKTLKGKDLAGLHYKPLFDFYAQDKNLTPNTYSVVIDDYVSDEDGTGLVHQAPAFGEDDFRVAQREGLPLWDPFNEEMIFQNPVEPFAGQQAKEADKNIVRQLKESGRLFKQETLQHSYPHCWRCDSPLVYRALKAWFMKIDPIKENMIQNNQTIHWVPKHLKEGRFGQWLENARDWNLSRNRYWGTPIPVWLCPNEHKLCIDSREKLERLSNESVSDLHKHFIDDITFDCPQCDQKMTRTSEVLDCWFESGSMPYAQIHYPFEEKEYFQKTFPADFITEAMDQTRGWFYSLTVLSSALFSKPAFQNVIVNGLLLASDGKKISKSKKNYTSPESLIEEFGADAFRLALINSAAVRGEAVRFTDEAVKEAARSVILPLVNSCQFFLTYAKADQWQLTPWSTETEKTKISSVELDRWIVSRLQTLVKEITQEMEQYNLNRMVPPLLSFLDELTNWYIRRSRRRFWKSENDADKESAYQTLHYVLVEFLKTLAPVLPFITETLYLKLLASQDESAKTSLHLCDYPKSNSDLIDLDLERRMAAARQAVNLGHALRKEHQIKVRQPLPELTLVARNDQEQSDFQKMEGLILEELNVKKIKYINDETSLVKISARPNFKTLGKRLGPKLKTFTPLLKNLESADLFKLEKGESITLEDESFTREDILVDREPLKGMAVGSQANVTIALDLTINNELLLEGRARELINRLQNLRKEKEFDVSDRIRLVLNLPEELKNAFEAHREIVCLEILATESEFSQIPQPLNFEIDDWKGSCQLEKISAS